MDYQFGQQGVVARTGAVTRIGKTVQADSGAGRRLVAAQHAASRPHQTVAAHGLQIHPGLNGLTARRRNPVLRKLQIGQARAGGDLQLQAHQVQPGDRFSDSVFDLQPRIGLDEGKALAVVLNQKLDGRQPTVTRRPTQAQCRSEQMGAQFLPQMGGRCNLNQFLALALHRTFTVPQMHHRT